LTGKSVLRSLHT